MWAREGERERETYTDVERAGESEGQVEWGIEGEWGGVGGAAGRLFPMY